MKRRILALAGALAACTILQQATQVYAIDRIAVENTSHELMLKEGPLYATWQQLNSGVTMGDFQLTNTYITVLDNTTGFSGTPVGDVSVKEPNWNSQWNLVYGGEGFDAKQFATTTIPGSTWKNRIFILESDGKLIMKEPVWNAGWWSGSIEPSGEVVRKVWAAGNNVIVQTQSGKLLGKDLTPGTYGHPSLVSWSVIATGVVDADVSPNRIAYTNLAGNVYAKDGKLNAPWHQGVIFDQITKIRVSDEKMCGIRSSGDTYCKQGVLSAGIAYTHNNAKDMELTHNRFVVLTKDNSVYAMTGDLIGNQNGWQMVAYKDALRVRAH